ncbi:sensor histidine kinase [Saccharopolyspora spinosporotrichia]|uniref:sensor histidine kinase n=1 Tax=Saccharopolyspora erythraea TaxID=1836 RepID=UPI0001D31526|nr:histidine kinase [Saccharopolyspora erythraea]EQD85347.1 histidine kinase [Saccharopolyspora erythraea D]QRK90879.1 two-component sensor histidine kinase [Saccharopolyspora erythraea]
MSTEEDAVVPTLLRLVRPFAARSTYLRWAHLVLGSTLAIPYLALAITVVGPLLDRGLLMPPLPAGLVLAVQVVFVLAACTATALVPVTRLLEGSVSKALIGGPVTGHDIGRAESWADRWRTAAWYLVHLSAGTLVGALTLVVPPFILVLLVSPVLDSAGLFRAHPLYQWFGLGEPWAPLAGLGLVAAGVLLVAGIGELLSRLAPVLLGPSARERLLHRVEQLSERNRIASELHDSVGHTLNVVTLQASAAGRVLDTDPEFARQALRAIEESTRRALEDLDHALGVLRAEAPIDRNTAPSLRDLAGLARSTDLAGLELRTDVRGDVDAVPQHISREAYRVAREGLTNVLRHAGPVPVDLRVVVDDGELSLDMTNPVGSARSKCRTGLGSNRRSGQGSKRRIGLASNRRSGLGLSGIRHRVQALGGEMSAGADGSRWRLRVRIPLRSSS